MGKLFEVNDSDYTTFPEGAFYETCQTCSFSFHVYCKGCKGGTCDGCLKPEVCNICNPMEYSNYKPRV